MTAVSTENTVTTVQGCSGRLAALEARLEQEGGRRAEAEARGEVLEEENRRLVEAREGAGREAEEARKEWNEQVSSILALLEKLQIYF